MPRDEVGLPASASAGFAVGPCLLDVSIGAIGAV
jgi:hypothetical protein